MRCPVCFISLLNYKQYICVLHDLYTILGANRYSAQKETLGPLWHSDIMVHGWSRLFIALIEKVGIEKVLQSTSRFEPGQGTHRQQMTILRIKLSEPHNVRAVTLYDNGGLGATAEN